MDSMHIRIMQEDGGLKRNIKTNVIFYDESESGPELNDEAGEKTTVTYNDAVEPLKKTVLPMNTK